MGYHRNLSIDTRTCGRAADDAWLDRRDGFYRPEEYTLAPSRPVRRATTAPHVPAALSAAPAAPTAPPSRRLTILPPVDRIAQTLRRLSGDAMQRGDYAAMRAYDNAAGDLADGRLPSISDNTYLVPSSSRSSMYHRVSRMGEGWSCNCEFGKKGKSGSFCRHIALAEGITAAWCLADRCQPGGGSDEVPATLAAEDAEMPLAEEAGEAPVCCTQPMVRDGAVWYCSKCKHWQFV